MHSYYAENKDKFKVGMGKFLIHISPELEKISGRRYVEILMRFGITMKRISLNVFRISAETRSAERKISPFLHLCVPIYHPSTLHKRKLHDNSIQSVA